MMQAETFDTVKGPHVGGSTSETVSSRLSHEPAYFWRAIPILFGMAAWLPQIWAALAALGQMPRGIGFEAGNGGLLQSNILRFLGPDGLVLVGAVLAGVITYAIWAIARAVGAPRWAAALVASLWVVAPMFGLTPSPVAFPDDAAFSAFLALALAAVIWSGRRESGGFLLMAFVLAIIASLLRPGAAWPALAIGVAAYCASDQLEEGPLVGTLSALCWAPGLQFAHYIFGRDVRPASLTPPPSFLDGVRADITDSLGRFGNVGLTFAGVIKGLLAALPFILLGLAALAGLMVAFLLGGARRRGAIAAFIGAICCAFGALGYGSLDAARLLLDPILLGLAAALGLIIPALIDRAKTLPAR